MNDVIHNYIVNYQLSCQVIPITKAKLREQLY